MWHFYFDAWYFADNAGISEVAFSRRQYTASLMHYADDYWLMPMLMLLMLMMLKKMCGRKREYAASALLCIMRHAFPLHPPTQTRREHPHNANFAKKLWVTQYQQENQTERELEANDIMQNCRRSRYLNPLCILHHQTYFPARTDSYGAYCVIYYPYKAAQQLKNISPSKILLSVTSGVFLTALHQHGPFSYYSLLYFSNFTQYF